MKALIIGSGTFAGRCLDFSGENPFVICADGGYDSAVRANLKPSVVLGDMDSVKNAPEGSIVYPTEKDETDSEIAIDYAIDHGFSEIILAGFTGTRLDHTLNNILLLKKIADKGLSGVIVDDNNEIYYLKDKLSLSGNRGDFLSIIPVFGDLTGITTYNLKYPLNNETLYFGKSRGISNELLGSNAEITVKSGEGIVIKSKD